MQYILDGTKFSVELPSDNDFEFLADLIRTQKGCLDENTNEWSLGFDTWEDESSDGISYDIEARLIQFSYNIDCEFMVIFDGKNISERESYVGFRPVLFSCKEGSRQPNGAVFNGISEGTELKMYSMLLNGQPVCASEAPQFKENDKITFTDKYFDDRFLITWVVIGDVAIAKHNLLYNVSWDDLQKQGFA